MSNQKTRAVLVDENKELRAKLAAAEAAAQSRSTDAINNPVNAPRRPDFESFAEDAGVAGAAEFTTHAGDGSEDAVLREDARGEHGNESQVIVTGSLKDLNEKKVAYERFMQDVLDVYIHPTALEDDPPAFDVQVNGRTHIFAYGATTKCKRYFVEKLARMKRYTYGNQVYVDRDGVRKVRNPRTTTLRYAFNIERDPAGRRGVEWLENIRAQA